MKNRTLISLFMLLISLCPLLAHAQSALDGMWEGKLYTYSKDVDSGVPMDAAKQPDTVRLLIKDEPVGWWYRTDEGDWEGTYKGFFKLFTIQHEDKTLVGNFLRSGFDEDGKWVEQQMFHFTLKDPNTLQIYWFRGVNNVNLPLTTSYSKWARFRVGELKRVQRDNKIR